MPAYEHWGHTCATVCFNGLTVTVARLWEQESGRGTRVQSVSSTCVHACVHL